MKRVQNIYETRVKWALKFISAIYDTCVGTV